MTSGSSPTDDGGLLLTKEEKVYFESNYPSLVKYIRPFIGAREFLHDKGDDFSRYCFWFGKFIACVTAEEKLCNYISYFGLEKGFSVSVSQDVYSSDSTPFADKGIPAVSFARIAPNNAATIHNSYDTPAVMSGEQMAQDIDFLIAFTQRMVTAAHCPVAKEMPQNMKDKLDNYLCRKRPENK